jgi:hypothetical protein
MSVVGGRNPLPSKVPKIQPQDVPVSALCAMVFHRLVIMTCDNERPAVVSSGASQCSPSLFRTPFENKLCRTCTVATKYPCRSATLQVSGHYQNPPCPCLPGRRKERRLGNLKVKCMSGYGMLPTSRLSFQHPDDATFQSICEVRLTSVSSWLQCTHFSSRKGEVYVWSWHVTSSTHVKQILVNCTAHALTLTHPYSLVSSLSLERLALGYLSWDWNFAVSHRTAHASLSKMKSAGSPGLVRV